MTSKDQLIFMTSYGQVVLTHCCETSFSVINKFGKNIDKMLNDILISRGKVRDDQRNSCLNTTRITKMAAARYNYNNGSHTPRTFHV